MDYICAKLLPKSKNTYRTILSSKRPVYPDFNPLSVSAIPYQCGTLLEDGELFFVEDAKDQDFAINLMKRDYRTQDFEAMAREEFLNIDFLFVLQNKSPFIFFQNISRPKLITRKRLIRMGERFVYRDDWDEITIHDTPDAIYDKATDRLYFYKLEAVTGILKGIDQLYREATNTETEAFLAEGFITLKDDFSAAKVKTANRKRIALAQETLRQLTPAQRRQMSEYIGGYCPYLRNANSKFEIGSEQDLKMLLYGIEQRFYTTPISSERRLANSVIALS